MLKILLLEYSSCKKCKSKYEDQNKPYLLSCGETICQKCILKLNGNVNLDNLNNPFSFKCPFDNSHTHNNNNITINLAFKQILDCCIELDKKNNNKNSVSLKDILLSLKNEKKIKIEDNVLTDEIVYEIPMKDNKPVGKGKLIHKSKGMFEGEFNGFFDKGLGTILYNDDKGIYKGSWENYERNGKGIMEYSNLDKYEGGFKNDFFDGFGKYYSHSEKKIYEGNWKNGKKNGIFKIKDYNDNLMDEKEFVMGEEK